MWWMNIISRHGAETSFKLLVFLRLLRMKVENQKTFKFSFQLTLQLGKEEKLKVINWWDRLTKVFLIFFMLIFNLYLFNLSGKKLDSDVDTTGEEDVLSKVTVAHIFNVCHNPFFLLALLPKCLHSINITSYVLKSFCAWTGRILFVCKQQLMF